jgi:hypothetical protein
MSFSKKERDQHNKSRDLTCKELNISKNDYNWFRRKGHLLHKVYEDNCNGVITEQEYEKTTSFLYAHTDRKAQDMDLYIYYQTDPRGGTIYLSKDKEMNQTNYNTKGFLIW